MLVILSYEDMMQRRTSLISMAMMAVLSVVLISGTGGEEYRVGGGLWTIPPTENYYANWSSSVNFLVHDKLVFEFDSEFHELMQVARLGYDNCNAESPIEVFTSSPAVVVFQEPAVLYFICNVSDHCLLGQKISVVVQPHQSSHLPPTPPVLPLLSPAPSPHFLPPPVTNTTPRDLPPPDHSGHPTPTCVSSYSFALMITLLLLLV